MIQNKDQYIGEREPSNRLRQGQGIYTYSNKYFQYEGQWQNGKKHGHGILRMNAPGGLSNESFSGENTFNGNINQYEGDFYEGEITGKGVYKYSNGTVYDGEFLMGEKHGYGVLTSEYEEYKGQWQQNQYYGDGELIKRIEGLQVKGEFKNHKPHGQCSIVCEEKQWEYNGQLQKGLKHGNGKYESKQFVYEGQWENDLKQGVGNYKYQSGFNYEGDWDQDQPKLVANRLKIQEHKVQQEDQEQEQQQQQDQQQENIIEYELLSKPFSIQIKSMYQPPPELDPVQPTEEEIEELVKNWQKENKKNKNPPPMPDFREPRMIDPEQIHVPNESNRKIKLTLIFELDPEKGKENEPRETKVLRLDYREQIERKKQEIEELKRKKQEEAELEAQQQKEEAKNAKGKKQPAAKDKKKEADNEQDYKILLYDENEEDQNKPLQVLNNNGDILIENLEFPEDFPPSQGGKYYIKVEDVSKEKFGEVESTQIDLVINPQGGADPKKKKK